MDLLRMYVVPCDNAAQANVRRAVESLENVLDVDVCVLRHRDLNQMEKGDVPWYGYIYSNEWIDESLQLGLPFFYKEKGVDCLVLFKKIIEDFGGVTNPKVFQTARIFRSHIELDSDLTPDMDGLKLAKVMDGWLLEPHRKIQ